jgi:hypothetical protein
VCLCACQLACLPACLFAHLPVSLSTCLPICPYKTCLPEYLSDCQPVSLSAYLSVCLSASLPVRLLICPPICPSVHRSIDMSICRLIHSVRQSVSPKAPPFISLYISMSVCSSISVCLHNVFLNFMDNHKEIFKWDRVVNFAFTLKRFTVVKVYLTTVSCRLCPPTYY